MAKRDLGKLGVTEIEQLEQPLPLGIRCSVKLALRRDDDGTTFSQSIYVKVAGNGEAGPYDFTITVATDHKASGGISTYRGVETGTPVNAHGGQLNASSNSTTAPSITTTAPDTIVVGFFGMGSHCFNSINSDADVWSQIGERTFEHVQE